MGIALQTEQPGGGGLFVDILGILRSEGIVGTQSGSRGPSSPSAGRSPRKDSAARRFMAFLHSFSSIVHQTEQSPHRLSVAVKMYKDEKRPPRSEAAPEVSGMSYVRQRG